MNKSIVLISNIFPDVSNPAAGTFVANIADNLKNEGWLVDYITMKNGPGKRGMLSYVYFTLKVFLSIIKNKDSVFYVHYISHSSLGVVLAGLLGFRRKIVLNAHGSDVIKEDTVSNARFFLKKSIVRLALRYMTLLVLPSTYYKKLICEKYSLRKDKCIVSPSGGISLQRFSKGKHQNRNSPFTLGFVGRLTEDKGTKDFLALLEKFKSDRVEFKAIIVGSGPLSCLVSEFCSVNNNVEYYPIAIGKDLVSIYQLFDVFVFPTKRVTESLGLVGLEAMACGVPVVVYRGNGPETYVSEGYNGFKVESGSVEELYEKCLFLSGLSKDGKEQLSEQCLYTAHKYDSALVGKELSRVFSSM